MWQILHSSQTAFEVLVSTLARLWSETAREQAETRESEKERIAETSKSTYRSHLRLWRTSASDWVPENSSGMGREVMRYPGITVGTSPCWDKIAQGVCMIHGGMVIVGEWLRRYLMSNICWCLLGASYLLSQWRMGYRLRFTHRI